MGQTHGFPFISEGTEEPNVEALYAVTDGKWKRHPDRIGSVTVDETDTQSPNKVRLDVRIDFDDPPSTMTLEGTGDRVGGTLRKGQLRVTDSKGIAMDAPLVVHLNVRNPKRWGADDIP